MLAGNPTCKLMLCSVKDIWGRFIAFLLSGLQPFRDAILWCSRLLRGLLLGLWGCL